MESTMTRHFGSRSRIARVASAPFSSGIDRSISTTSGCVSFATRTASRPSGTVATTCRSGCASIRCLRPSATTPWSSAIRILMVMSEGDSRAQCSPFARRALYLQMAPRGHHALLHRGHAVPAGARMRLRVEPLAVVADGQHHVLLIRLEPQVDRFRAGVLGDVVERLLRDAEEGHPRVAPQLPVLLLRQVLELDRDARAPRELLGVPAERGTDAVFFQQRGPQIGHHVLD